jgi:hypothetical protein
MRLRMSLYPMVLQMKKLLGNLDGFLEKAASYAAAKKVDQGVMLQLRLTPDMFPFVRQVQATCDQAKYAVGRTTGKDIPAHPDTEQTVDDLKKRVASVISYLDGFSERDFAELDARTVTTPRWEGKSMTATNYFVEHAMPNFYFHLTSAYAILRANGVELGKRDYLGALTWR